MEQFVEFLVSEELSPLPCETRQMHTFNEQPKSLLRRTERSDFVTFLAVLTSRVLAHVCEYHPNEVVCRQGRQHSVRSSIL